MPVARRPRAHDAGARDDARCVASVGSPHVDDPERVAFYRERAARAATRPARRDFDERSGRLLRMLAWGLGLGAGESESFDAFFAALWRERGGP